MSATADGPQRAASARQTAVRCVACLTPVARPWHRLCHRCLAWSLLGEHLRRASRAARRLRGMAP